MLRSICAQAAIPHLRRAGGGHIVLFSDWVAASGRPRYRGFLPYYVAKRGVVALGEALALELGRRRHPRACRRPGPHRAGRREHAAGAGGGARRDPLGRWGGEDEVARTVVALLGSTFVTGETVRVDGGRHLR